MDIIVIDLFPPGVVINRVTNFKVTYSSKVRKLFVSVVIRSPRGKVLYPLIKSNYDGCNVSYTPREIGTYTVEVYANGKEIPTSPLKMQAESDGKPIVEEEMNRPKAKKINFAEPTDGKPGGKKPWQKPGAGDKPDWTKKPLQKQPKGDQPDKTKRRFGKPEDDEPEWMNAHLKPWERKPKPQPEEEEVKPRTFNIVKVTGDGVVRGVANKPTSFMIDSTEAGDGKIDVDIQGPEKPTWQVTEISRGKTKVTYTPTQPGVYTVVVLFNSKPVSGSPFKPDIKPMKVSPQAAKVRVYGDGIKTGTVNQVSKFVIDTSGAGTAKPIFTITGPGEVKTVTKSLGFRKLEVSYTPEMEGEYVVDVTYDDTSVPDAPFKPVVKSAMEVPANKVKVYGSGTTEGKTNEPNKFVIDTSEAGNGKLEFDVAGPAKPKVQSKEISPKKTEVTYTPSVPGVYSIDVKYDQTPVPGSPFKPKIQPGQQAKPSKPEEKVKVYGQGIESGEVNQMTTFTVDTTESGPGKLGFDIKGPSKAKLTTKEVSVGKCEVSYVPTLVGEYTVTVTYNNRPVPGVPFKPKITPGKMDKPFKPIEMVKVFGDGITKGVSGEITKFVVDTSEAGPGKLGFDIKGPGKAKLTTKDLGSGRCEVSYTPTLAGEYTINVTYNSASVPGAPFKPKIEMAKSSKPLKPVEKVKVYGDGISSGVTKQVTNFIVDTSEAGPGRLGFDIKGPSKAVLTTKDLGSGKCEVSYTPTLVGEYAINVTYNGTSVPGAPFKPKIGLGKTEKSVKPVEKVKVYGDGVTSGVAGEVTKFVIDTSAAGPGKLGFDIKGPGKASLTTKDLGSGKCEVSYTPTLAGEYTVNATYDGAPVPGAPFKPKIVVGKTSKAPHPADKVKVFGDGVTSGVTGQVTKFVVDSSAAGPGKLEFDAKGPSNVKLTTKNVGFRKSEVSYTPTMAGEYTIDVTYDGVPVPGTPFKPRIEVAHMASRVRVYGDGINSGKTNQPTKFIVDTTDAGPGKLDFNMKGPNQPAITSKEITPGKSEVTFTATLVGSYEIDVLYNGERVPGAPFKPKIELGTQQSAASKVKVFGNGVASGKTNEPTKFVVDTSEAGPGKLGFDIGGPEKAVLRTNDIGNGKCEVTYTPIAVGEYSVHITYDGTPVPGSPFKPQVIVGRSISNAKKVKVDGSGIKSPKVNKINVFIVDTTSAGPGKLDCDIDGPRKPKVDIKNIGNGKYEASFTPVTTGEIIINVLYDDVPVLGSPFKLLVTVEESPAQKVTVDGDNVKAGEVGKVNTFVVDTSQAGFGDLGFDIRGPGKATITAKKISTDKCEVSYTPEIAGIYAIDVTYDGELVKGAPFMPEIRVPSTVDDASKVKISGDGIENCEINKRTVFKVDTSSVGAGKLDYDFTGPEDIKVTSKKLTSQETEVSYTPRKTGTYQLKVQYNGTDVPNSPFAVLVVPEGTLMGKKLKCKRTGVIVSGDGIKTGTCDDTTSFVIDTSVSGPGKLSFGMKGPSKATMKTEQVSPTETKVSYVASAPGDYGIDIMFNEKPLSFGTVSSHIKPSQSGKPVAQQPTAIKPEASEPLQSQAPAQQRNPSVVQCEITKVKLSGVDVKEGVCGEPTSFVIDTLESGPGRLGFATSGPSKAKISTRDIEHGKCEVFYTPTEPGTYSLMVSFNDQPLSVGPVKTQVVTSSSKTETIPTVRCEATKVVLKGEGIETAECNKPSTFIVDTTESGPGSLGFDVKGPSKAVLTTRDLGNGKVEVSYFPTVQGEYTIDVTHNGRKLTKSPVAVVRSSEEVRTMKTGSVDETESTPQPYLEFPDDVPSETCQETGIQLQGKGIRQGASGERVSFIVDTTEAKPGKLGFKIQGPGNAPLETRMIENGKYEVSYIPTASGEYEITITQGSKTVLGKPVKIVIGESSTQALTTRSAPKTKYDETVEVEKRNFGEMENTVTTRTATKETKSGNFYSKETVRTSETQSAKMPVGQQGFSIEELDDVAYGSRVVEETITAGQVRNVDLAPGDAELIARQMTAEDRIVMMDSSTDQAYGSVVEKTIQTNTSQNTASSSRDEIEKPSTEDIRLLAQQLRMQPDVQISTRSSEQAPIEENILTSSTTQQFSVVDSSTQQRPTLTTETSEVRGTTTTTTVGRHGDSQTSRSFVSSMPSAVHEDFSTTSSTRQSSVQNTITDRPETTSSSQDVQTTETIKLANFSQPETTVGTVNVTRSTTGAMPTMEDGTTTTTQRTVTRNVVRTGDQPDVGSVENVQLTETINLANFGQPETTVSDQSFVVNSRDASDMSQTVTIRQPEQSMETEEIEATFTISADSVIEESVETIRRRRSVNMDTANLSYTIDAETDVTEQRYSTESQTMNFSVSKPAQVTLRPEESIVVTKRQEQRRSTGPASKVVVTGECLKRAVVNRQEKFVIDMSKAGSGKLNFTASGPGDATLTARDLGKNRFEVTFAPTEMGTYMLEITFDGQPVAGSPFYTYVTSDRNLNVSSIRSRDISHTGMGHRVALSFVGGVKYVTAWDV